MWKQTATLPGPEPSNAILGRGGTAVLATDGDSEKPCLPASRALGGPVALPTFLRPVYL